MRTEQHRISTRDGVSLHLRWTPAGEDPSTTPGPPPSVAASPRVRPTVLITHGLGEHSARYWHVEERLVSQGYDVASYDLRGHGRSGGRRGDAPGFRAFLDDLEEIIAAVNDRRASTSSPLFLFGHSLGALITLRFLQEHTAASISGAIAASPWLRLAFAPARWKLVLAAITRVLCPRYRQITGLDTSRLSRDQAFLAAMPDLHLSHHQLSARLFYEIRQSCKAALENPSPIPCPLLLLHGQADPVTSWEATNHFFQAASSPDKTLKLYPGVFHEAHNDLDREQVLGDIVAWIQERTHVPRREGRVL